MLQIGSTAGAIGLLAHEAAQGRSAVLNAVLYDAAHGLNPVAPIDLLALGVSATRVGDPNLPHAPAASCDFCGHLGLNTEALLFQFDPLDYLSAECLEARLHIGEVEIGEHVRQQR